MNLIQTSKGYEALMGKQREDSKQDLGYLKVSNDVMANYFRQKTLATLEQDKSKSKTVQILVDTSQKDLGVMIRLCNLQKRLGNIEQVIGEWKKVRLKQNDILFQDS